MMKSTTDKLLEELLTRELTWWERLKYRLGWRLVFKGQDVKNNGYVRIARASN